MPNQPRSTSMSNMSPHTSSKTWHQSVWGFQNSLVKFCFSYYYVTFVLNNLHFIFFAMTSRHIVHFLFRCISRILDPQGSNCNRRRRGLRRRINKVSQDLRESASEKRWTSSLSPRTSSNLFFNVSRFTGVCELEVVAIIPIPSYLAKLELQHHRLQMKADEDFEDTLLKHLSYEDIWC